MDWTDQQTVRALAAILRIAVGLDRTQDGRVKKMSVALTDLDLNISFTTSKTLDNELNEFAANERRSLLAEVLGLRVKISAS